MIYNIYDLYIIYNTLSIIFLLLFTKYSIYYSIKYIYNINRNYKISKNRKTNHIIQYLLGNIYINILFDTNNILCLIHDVYYTLYI